MASGSRLGRQIEEVITALSSIGASNALIGGLALAAHRVVRATQDVDLLADASAADQADDAIVKLGYTCLHRTSDVANYLRGDERLDVLFASRPLARRLLAQATERVTAFGVLRVISAEGLIAFKVQGWVNDARRTQDLEDIRALLRANRGRVDLDEVRGYFRLFDREPLLDELLNDDG